MAQHIFALRTQFVRQNLCDIGYSKWQITYLSMLSVDQLHFCSDPIDLDFFQPGHDLHYFLTRTLN